MSDVIDARGLSCPQPVLLAMDEMKKGRGGKFTILLDSETSKENVTRAAGTQGWSVNEISDQDEEFKLELSRG